MMVNGVAKNTPRVCAYLAEEEVHEQGPQNGETTCDEAWQEVRVLFQELVVEHIGEPLRRVGEGSAEEGTNDSPERPEKTVYGEGYRLVGFVSELPEDGMDDCNVSGENAGCDA